LIKEIVAYETVRDLRVIFDKYFDDDVKKE
jgi:esterase/lipase superfamily enzyme